MEQAKERLRWQGGTGEKLKISHFCSLHGKGQWGGEGAGERGGGTYPFAFALVFLPALPPPFAPVKQAKLRNRKYSYIISTGFLFKF